MRGSRAVKACNLPALTSGSTGGAVKSLSSRVRISLLRLRRLFSALALSLKCRSFGIFLSVKVSITMLLEPNWNQFNIKPSGLICHQGRMARGHVGGMEERGGR